MLLLYKKRFLYIYGPRYLVPVRVGSIQPFAVVIVTLTAAWLRADRGVMYFNHEQRTCNSSQL